jgi:hypothetical protein
VRIRPFVAVAAGVLLLCALPACVPGAPSPCGQYVSKIACENSLPGSPPAQWDVAGSGDPSIVGFTTAFSVNHGETVRFKVSTPAPAYTIDVYRMGWYQGNGARKVASVTPSVALPQTQPPCLSDPGTGLVDCGNWGVSASWTTPSGAVSGVYVARLRRTDTSGASHVFFVVRDDEHASQILFQTNDTTWQAYNAYGGNSLYSGAPVGRAYKVSYNRPFIGRALNPYLSFFSDQYAMLRFLERNGYDVSYFSGLDTDRRGPEIREHKVFLSNGHDEYWSKQQRANLEGARDGGVNLAFFSGNEGFWKTRWEPSIDGSATPNRTLVTYKETHANAKIDPSAEWTGTWRDPRFSPPADGGRPENALTGTVFRVNGVRADTIRVPAADGKMRFWRNTSVASLPASGVATLAPATLGFEWDEAPDNPARPPGSFHLSTTTLDITDGKYLLDYGSSYGNGTATHHLTMHRAASGALVFGAGTVHWAWGLDTENDQGGATPDVRMQQATVNVLADLGAQPTTRMAGLVAAAKSTDTAPPVATIAAPSAGAAVVVGSPVVVSGTASDSGGGVISAVEVSTDLGATWKPAVGRASWAYAWTPATAGPATIRVRAVDDSANVQPVPTGRTVNATLGCPCSSLWNSGVTPGTPTTSDLGSVELGVKFRADTAGLVTGVRFYKGAWNAGPHVGSLWSRTGTLLRSATFVGETASGWQQVNFASPVAVSANTTYVVSYHVPNGRYPVDLDFFAAAGTDAGPLHALATGVDGPNGVYKYGPSTAFPNESFRAANYWVDVVWRPAT